MPRIRRVDQHLYAAGAGIALTATGSGTGIDCLGYGLAAVTFVGSTDVSGTIDVNVYHSTNNSTWTLLGTVGQQIGNSKTNFIIGSSINLDTVGRYIAVQYVSVGAANRFSWFVDLLNPLQYPVVQTNTWTALP